MLNDLTLRILENEESLSERVAYDNVILSFIVAQKTDVGFPLSVLPMLFCPTRPDHQPR